MKMPKMSSDIIVRKVTIEDLSQLSVLFDDYRRFYFKQSDIVGATKFLKERIEKTESEIFVVEVQNRLLGFVQLYPIFSSTRMKRYWLLNDLFVKANHRGRGFSKALIEASQELCRETSSCGMYLETSKENVIGNQLYPSCGFKIYKDVNFYEWEISKD